MYCQKKLQKVAKAIMSIDECKRALMKMESNKTPGTDGLSSEFYRFFWNAVGNFMVESFNYAFQLGSLSISQRQGIISLIPKKNKNGEYLTQIGDQFRYLMLTTKLRLKLSLFAWKRSCQA